MKTVEEIVKDKAYFELSDAEKTIVEEIAPNEEAYNDLKFFLTETVGFYDRNKVMAGEGMRQHIMEKLYPPTSIPALKWYQSLWLFLVPPQKSFYQYPVFQLATVLLLFFGIFTFWNNPLVEQKLAQNTVQESLDNQQTEKIKVLNNQKDREPALLEKEIDQSINSIEIIEEVSGPEPVIISKNKNLLEPNADDDGLMQIVELRDMETETPKLEVDKALDVPNAIGHIQEEKDKETVIATESMHEEVMEVEIASQSAFSRKESKKLRESSDMSSEILELPKTLQVTDLKDLRSLFFEVK